MVDTYRDVPFISTDSHVTEPIELYAERVDARFRDRVPRIETQDGWRTLIVEGLDPRKLMTADEREVAIVGGVDAEERVRDQERDGVTAEVIFPTFALQACFASEDAELQRRLCRAYNDWAADAFAGNPRLIAVGRVPMLDIDAAIDEAHAPRRRRVPGAVPPGAGPVDGRTTTARTTASGPWPRSWGSRSRSTPVPATSRACVRGPGGAVINYLLGAQLDGPMVMLALAAGGALDRFPDLRVVTVETGAAWLGWIMTQADAIYEDHIMYARPKLSLKPSELIRRQAHATFMYDPVAINNRHITGVETIMWGNDYPHPEGTWPSSQEIAAKQFADVPDDELARHRRRHCGSGLRLRPPVASTVRTAV